MINKRAICLLPEYLYRTGTYKNDCGDLFYSAGRFEIDGDITIDVKCFDDYYFPHDCNDWDKNESNKY